MSFAQWRSEYFLVSLSTDAVCDLDLDRDSEGFLGFFWGIGDRGFGALAENFDTEWREEFLGSGKRPELEPWFGDGALSLLL
jgi:hypothetical protein